MSGEWKDRDEKTPFDILEELKEIEKIINKLEQQPHKDNRPYQPHVYVVIIADPKLSAKLQETTNIYKPQKDEGPEGQKDPLVDVFDEKDKVLVVAEAPNTKKEDIELEETGGFLTVYVKKPQRRLFKTIELPAEIKVEEAKINCKNGVLAVVLPKVA